jgi:hypothetical protein
MFHFEFQPLTRVKLIQFLILFRVFSFLLSLFMFSEWRGFNKVRESSLCNFYHELVIWLYALL